VTRKFMRSIVIWLAGMGMLTLAVSGVVRKTQRTVGRLETVELLPLAAKADAAGDLDEARTLYESILGYTPESRVALLGSARVAFQQGRFTEALTRCNTSLAIAGPESGFDEQLLRGNLLLALGRFAEATNAYRSAASAKPTAPEPHWGIAQAAEAACDYATMRDALNAVSKLDFASASRAYREHRERLQQTIDAAGRSILGADPSAQGYYTMASALRDSGRWTEAMDAFAKSSELPGSPADSWFWLGAGAMADGDAERARRQLNRAVEATPHHRAALRALQRLDDHQDPT